MLYFTNSSAPWVDWETCFWINPFSPWEVPTSRLATYLCNQSSCGKSTYCYCGKNKQGQQEIWTCTGNVQSVCHKTRWHDGQHKAKTSPKKKKSWRALFSWLLLSLKHLPGAAQEFLPFLLVREKESMGWEQVLARERRGEEMHCLGDCVTVKPILWIRFLCWNIAAKVPVYHRYRRGILCSP